MRIVCLSFSLFSFCWLILVLIFCTCFCVIYVSHPNLRSVPVYVKHCMWLWAYSLAKLCDLITSLVIGGVYEINPFSCWYFLLVRIGAWVSILSWSLVRCKRTWGSYPTLKGFFGLSYFVWLLACSCFPLRVTPILLETVLCVGSLVLPL